MSDYIENSGDGFMPHTMESKSDAIWSDNTLCARGTLVRFNLPADVKAGETLYIELGVDGSPVEGSVLRMIDNDFIPAPITQQFNAKDINT